MRLRYLLCCRSFAYAWHTMPTRTDALDIAYHANAFTIKQSNGFCTHLQVYALCWVYIKGMNIWKMYQFMGERGNDIVHNINYCKYHLLRYIRGLLYQSCIHWVRYSILIYLIFNVKVKPPLTQPVLFLLLLQMYQ